MIYIQSNLEKTLPHHFDCACVLYGAIENEYDYMLTSFEEVASGLLDGEIKKSLFVGSVEFMREVFSRINITNVGVPMNSDRECELITLQEAFDRTSNGNKLFIKPIQIKLFTGLVLDGMKYSCLNDIDVNTVIMAYEPFKYEIISEWRVYVQNNIVLDCKNYAGDFINTPNYAYIFTHVSNNASHFPKAYTMDVGVLENGENVIIEYNDMWAIGNYGVPNREYIRALRERYFEIIKDC